MVTEEAVKEVVDLLEAKADEESEKSTIFNSTRVEKMAREKAYRDAAEIVEDNLID